MKDKEKLYIANEILGEVKPLKSREKILLKLIDFIDDKLPEDSVVLSREEQEIMNNEWRDKVYQACKLEKQKTAEKIINHFVAEFPLLKTRVIARELAKQYGVEIKE